MERPPARPRSAAVRRFALFAALGLALGQASSARADTAREIDVGVDAALERFYADVKGGREFAQAAKGLLIFPKVFKAGIGVGGEYGEGALRVGGATAHYYNTASASIGFQLGAQIKTVLVAFMTDEALRDFRDGPGWEVGVDGSVALITLGAGGSIDSTNIRNPVVGFVFGQKGLMYNLTLEGSKFTRIER